MYHNSPNHSPRFDQAAGERRKKHFLSAAQTPPIYRPPGQPPEAGGVGTQTPPIYVPQSRPSASAGGQGPNMADLFGKLRSAGIDLGGKVDGGPLGGKFRR